jgi:glycosyltransferase involved in cell wall biosynthesis
MVSVILPNYNHAPYLEERINSILCQSYQDFELIILDDCSTDNSKEIIEQYRTNIKVSCIVFNTNNSGSPFPQWKKGIELAKGKYIWIAESDDFAETDFLALLVPVLERNNELGLVFSGSNWVDDQGKIGQDLSVYHKSFCTKGQEEIKVSLMKFNSIQNVSAVLFRADALKRIDWNFTKYKSCGDWILYVELLLKNDICFIADKLNNFRWFHTSVSSNAEKKGQWIYEGVDVLLLAQTDILLSFSEKESILRSWKDKIKPLRKTMPFSLFQLITIHKKLFQFSPLTYLKVFTFNK